MNHHLLTVLYQLPKVNSNFKLDDMLLAIALFRTYRYPHLLRLPPISPSEKRR